MVVKIPRRHWKLGLRDKFAVRQVGRKNDVWKPNASHKQYRPNYNYEWEPCAINFSKHADRFELLSNRVRRFGCSLSNYKSNALWGGTILKNDGTVKGAVRWVRWYGTGGYGTVGTVGTVRWVRWVRYSGYSGYGTVGTVVRYGGYGTVGAGTHPPYPPHHTHRTIVPYSPHLPYRTQRTHRTVPSVPTVPTVPYPQISYPC